MNKKITLTKRGGQRGGTPDIYNFTQYTVAQGIETSKLKEGGKEAKEIPT